MARRGAISYAEVKPPAAPPRRGAKKVKGPSPEHLIGNRGRTGPARSVHVGGSDVDKVFRKDKKLPPPAGTEMVYCGGKLRGGKKGSCRKKAGWGTIHPGIGKCKLHGGGLPNHVKAAAKAEQRLLLGIPIETNPYEALSMCIKIRAGEVKWLSDRMSELDQEDWVENTIAGKQFHLYARERHRALSDLARYSQMAISLGIAERAVRLYEQYGETLALLIRGILGDLDLTEEQRAKAPQIIRKHLLSISESETSTLGNVPALQPGEHGEVVEDAVIVAETAAA
jgi:hypothetical protein